jgi:hypothetical protein
MEILIIYLTLYIYATACIMLSMHIHPPRLHNYCEERGGTVAVYIFKVIKGAGSPDRIQMFCQKKIILGLTKYL